MRYLLLVSHDQRLPPYGDFVIAVRNHTVSRQVLRAPEVSLFNAHVIVN